MITLQIGVGGIIIGFFVGTAIAFFAIWLADRDINKSNEEPSGFSKGFDAGWHCGREFEAGTLRKDLRYNRTKEDKNEHKHS